MIARCALILCLLGLLGLLPPTPAAAAPSGPAPVTARYACSDGSRLTALFAPPGAAGASVLLRRPGSRRPTRLPQVLSADGGRYAAGDQEFWIKGNAATYTRGRAVVTCRTA
ncbi:MAG: MliC family protein [Microvirga sp.]